MSSINKINSIQNDALLSFDDTEIAFKYLSNQSLKKSILLFKVINNNVLVKIGPIITQFALKIGLPIKELIKYTLFNQFCGGETIDDCSKTINLLATYNVGTILDYSVEGNDYEKSFDHTHQEIINTLIKSASMPQQIPFAVFKVSGLARVTLLQKVSENKILTNSEKFEYDKAFARVLKICQTAYDLDVKIMIDAEESWIQPVINDLALAMMQKFNVHKAIVYNTYQLYRNTTLLALKADTLLAQHQKFYLGAKLVRGAYMEKERQRALDYGYPTVINPDKETTDNYYNDALRYCIHHINCISFVAGTHNEYSCKLLTYLMRESNLDTSHQHIYFSQLLGMSDNLSFNLANAGYNVAKYVPYGPVKLVMPYLFRRAQENTAIAGQASRELLLLQTELARRQQLK